MAAVAEIGKEVVPKCEAPVQFGVLLSSPLAVVAPVALSLPVVLKGAVAVAVAGAAAPPVVHQEMATAVVPPTVHIFGLVRLMDAAAVSTLVPGAVEPTVHAAGLVLAALPDELKSAARFVFSVILLVVL